MGRLVAPPSIAETDERDAVEVDLAGSLISIVIFLFLLLIPPLSSSSSDDEKRSISHCAAERRAPRPPPSSSLLSELCAATDIDDWLCSDGVPGLLVDRLSADAEASSWP